MYISIKRRFMRRNRKKRRK